MRTVVSSYEVAQMWANQSQEHARNARGNFYFLDSTIYSYGAHFPIARHVTHRGRHAVLLTTRRYSVTTSRHQKEVRHAACGLDCLYVPDLFPDKQYNCGSPYSGYHTKIKGHRTNLNWFAAYIKQAAERLKRSRTYIRQLITNLDALVEAGNHYTEFFGLKTRYSWPADLDKDESLERAEYWEARRAELSEKRRVEEEARWEAAQVARKNFIETYRAKVALWRDGADVSLPDMPYDMRDTEGVALRLCWPHVQASIGVDASISDVVALLELVRAGRQKTWSYQWVDGELVDLSRDAPHFPPYRVTGVDENGCVNLSSGHFIVREEIERIGILLGLRPQKTDPPDWYVALLNNLPIPGVEAGRSLKRRRRTIRLYEEE